MKVSDKFNVSVQIGDNNRTTNVLEIRKIRQAILDMDFIPSQEVNPTETVISLLKSFYKYKGSWEIQTTGFYPACIRYDFFKKNSTNEFIKVIIGLKN